MTPYQDALKAAGGNKSSAARALGMPWGTFDHRLKAERDGRAIKTTRRRQTIAQLFGATTHNPIMSAAGLVSPAKPRAVAPTWSPRGNRIVHDDGSRLLEMASLPETVLCFSCTQAPFQHTDTIPFLATVLASYKPDMVVCQGDEVDLKFLKRAFMRPDGPGPDAELSAAVDFMHSLFQVVPEAVCLTSNHVAGRIDHGASNGNFPSRMLRPWAEVCNAPPTWIWRDYLIMRNWLFEHGQGVAKGARASMPEDTVKRFGRQLSVMRGHFHSEFGEHIKPVWTSGNRQLRVCYTGCLMDPREATYTRAALMLGCVVLVRGVPHPVPLATDSHGRWTGKLVEW